MPRRSPYYLEALVRHPCGRYIPYADAIYIRQTAETKTVRGSMYRTLHEAHSYPSSYPFSQFFCNLIGPEKQALMEELLGVTIQVNEELPVEALVVDSRSERCRNQNKKCVRSSDRLVLLSTSNSWTFYQKDSGNLTSVFLVSLPDLILRN